VKNSILGNFDEMIVASREITSSTAQLVAASRVKANRTQLLSELETIRYLIKKFIRENFAPDFFQNIMK
jgi:hypothetical protein